MAVDISLQYNGYNSYKFNNGDSLVCYPYGVQNMGHITHSFGMYSPIVLSDSVRAYTRFFGASSEVLQTVNHSFGVAQGEQGIFKNIAITVEVPVGARQAELVFVNSVSSPWWVATPKSEEGTNATPYAINAYGQLTYITPNGIYTGTLTASQIVVSNPNDKLSDRLTKITPAGVYTGEVRAQQISVNNLAQISASLGTITSGNLLNIDMSGASYSFGSDGTFMLKDANNAALITPNGILDTNNITASDNVNSGFPLIIRFYIDDNVQVVDQVKLIIANEKFRAYSSGAASGGATTSKSGGGGTSGSGGYLWDTTKSLYDITFNSNLTGRESAHQHTYNTLGTHSHSFEVPSHTHSIDSHTHTIQAHTHGIVYGIYEGATPSNAVTIWVDGTQRATASSKDTVVNLSSWVTTKGWHTVEVRSTVLKRVSAGLFIKSYIRR